MKHVGTDCLSDTTSHDTPWTTGTHPSPLRSSAERHPWQQWRSVVSTLSRLRFVVGLFPLYPIGAPCLARNARWRPSTPDLHSIESKNILHRQHDQSTALFLNSFSCPRQAWRAQGVWDEEDVRELDEAVKTVERRLHHAWWGNTHRRGDADQGRVGRIFGTLRCAFVHGMYLACRLFAAFRFPMDVFFYILNPLRTLCIPSPVKTTLARLG